jgi:hypothetical protein
MRTLSVVGVLLLVLCACSSGPQPAPVVTEASSITILPTHTPQATYTPHPTYTPPPTYTPYPTTVPSATPLPPTPTQMKPTFQKWNSAEVIAAFRAAGLEVGDTWTLKKDDLGMAPMIYVEGTRFLVPSVCADCGGKVFDFAKLDDLDRTREYYVELGEASAVFFSWTFVKDNILLQINGDLPEDKARAYEATLGSLK